ncbi:MAG TPA: DUF4398 domain-containing protein [Polyangiales bacterium]|nr:DUF4398 domain-containing protein [Polyangiales bacterium]
MKVECIGTIVGAALLGAACAGAPKPVNQLASTEAALRAAREVGAEQQPEAALHTKLASEQLQRAQQLMQDDDNLEASRVLARAKADAELALAMARRAEAQTELNQARSSDSTPTVGMVR